MTFRLLGISRSQHVRTITQQVQQPPSVIEVSDVLCLTITDETDYDGLPCELILRVRLETRRIPSRRR